MTDERRADDSRIDEILRTVGHIDTSIRDHERRIVESEKVLIRVQERQLAADNKFAAAIYALEEKVDGVVATVTAFSTDFRADFHAHTDQEDKDRRGIIKVLAALVVTIVGSISAMVMAKVFV